MRFIKRLFKRSAQILIVIVAVLAVAMARGCAFRPTSSYGGSHFNQGKNGVWLGVEWVSEPHNEVQIIALANDLARNQIRYVFVYISYLRTDTLNFGANFDHAANFVKVFKKAQPTIKLLAWLGLPMPSLAGMADLSDPTIRQKVTTMSITLIREMAFDGIHLDPETVQSGDQNLIALLGEMRKVIGTQALLSLATEKIQPLLPEQSLFGAHLGWSSQYYQQIAQHVDQIVVMTYDTGLHIDWLYRELIRFQVIGISQAVHGTGVELLFGVPTSEEVSNTHDPAIETISNGLQGIMDGLNDHDSLPSIVSGVAIYPQWDMTEAKWSLFEAKWLESSP